MWNGWNITQEDCKTIHELLEDWMYTKRYGSGDEPASEKQVRFIDRLGGTAPLGMNKKEASRMIKHLLENKT